MMKLIDLDLQQRKEIERRRHATRGRRIYEWLSVVLWVAGGKDRFDVADLLGCSVLQVAEWLRLFRNAGLDADPARSTHHTFYACFPWFQGFSGGKSDTSEALAVQR
jgi:hypothetical protein